MLKEALAARHEARIPMTIAVNISSLQQVPGIETTFTENVSAHGARVVSTRRWLPGEQLTFALLPGDFRATARVVYCHPQRDAEFAIGLEFLEPVARWFTNPQAGSGDHLHG
jgi:hypothetical protein